MGCVASTFDDAPETSELRRLSDTLVRMGCQRTTVQRALKIFGKADKDGSGSINIAEFAEMFKLRTTNAFLPRLLSLFDVTGDGDIGALEFVLCLAQFFTNDQHAHIYFAWRLFDQDDSGSMTAEEFREILFNTMNYLGKGGNADKMEDRKVVLGRAGARVKVKGFATLIAEADVDHNGVITIDEFKVLASRSTHLVAPAFELWSALEEYSKPCYLLKQEIINAGKWKQVATMINPKAAASMKIERGEETKARRPQRPSDHRETRSAPQGGARRERRAAPRADEPEPVRAELYDAVGARESRQLGGNAEKASREERTQRRSHHARDGREHQHRSHHQRREDRAGRHRHSEHRNRHGGNPRRTQEVPPSQYYDGYGGGAGGGRADVYGASAHRQQQQSYDQGMPPMDSHYAQRAPHTQQQRYGQGSPQMYQQQYGHGAPPSPAYNGGYDNGGYGGQPQRPHGHANMHAHPRGSPARGAPPRRTHDDEMLNQLERDLGF